MMGRDGSAVLDGTMSRMRRFMSRSLPSAPTAIGVVSRSRIGLKNTQILVACAMIVC